MRYLFCLVLLLLGHQSLRAEPSPAKVRIGVSIPLTGPVANYGTDMRNALLFANQEMAGGAYELVFEDDKCEGREAVTVANKLVKVDQVKYVIGFACSGTLLSAAGVYERNKVVAVTSMATAPAISQAGRHIFRTWVTSDEEAANTLVRYIASQHDSLGILSEETSYAQAIGEAAERAARRDNLAVWQERYLPGNTDHRAELLKLKTHGMAALFINSQDDLHFVQILRQARQIYPGIPVYGAYFPGSEYMRREAGSLAEKIHFVDAPATGDLLTPQGIETLARFGSKYGNPGYELLVVTTVEAFRAIHQAHSSGQDPVTYLESAQFNGLFGPWRFNKDGDIEGISPVIKVIEGGEVRVVK